MYSLIRQIFKFAILPFVFLVSCCITGFPVFGIAIVNLQWLYGVAWTVVTLFAIWGFLAWLTVQREKEGV